MKAEIESEIAEMYEADQAARTVGWDNIDFEKMRADDVVRLKRAKEIYALHVSEIGLSGESLYQLGLLFQHSPDPEDYLIAKEIGELSGQLGCIEGAWLSAAAEDRYLLHKDGVQKWGTQFRKDKGGEWEQVPLLDDGESGINDDMRAAKNIPPRREQLQRFLERDDI